MRRKFSEEDSESKRILMSLKIAVGSKLETGVPHGKKSRKEKTERTVTFRYLKIQV